MPADNAGRSKDDFRIDDTAIADHTAQHAIFWLVSANLVGIWLSLLLLFPEWGKHLGPMTYGRWMPLHMNWHLYGWCTVPLLGVVLSIFLQPVRQREKDAATALFVWSTGLAGGGIWWLKGQTSGKLFLDWQGWPRVLFPICIFLIWSILFYHWQLSHPGRSAACEENSRWTRWKFAGKGIMLLVLFTVPITLYWASGRPVYPPIDPHSGGATGHSLLASTLGIVFIFGWIPEFSNVLRKGSSMRWRRRIFWIWYFISVCVYMSLGHGNEANTQPGQIRGLATLLLWIPVFCWYYKGFNWSELTKPWLWAFLFWWSLLVIDGLLIFLPGWLDVFKFTHALVAHAHLAMAGMVTSANFLILDALLMKEPGVSPERPWHNRFYFFLWQAGCLTYIFCLTWQGWREGVDPSVLFYPNLETTHWLAGRTVAGILMTVASVMWFPGMIDGKYKNESEKSH